MPTRIIFVTVYIIAIIGLFFVIKSLNKIHEEYGFILKRAMIAAIVAVIANILIAVSPNGSYAELAYCFYFASVDWTIYFLMGFCLSYT